jgi:hypothetical protein
MLEAVIADSLSAAIVREMASKFAAGRTALAGDMNSATRRVFASPGIFLPHLHAETAGGVDGLAAAGVTSWTLAVFGTDFGALGSQIAKLARSPLAAAPGFRGVFVEGPFISVVGAADFDIRGLEAFLDGAALPIATLAFAPERSDPGALLELLDEKDVCGVIAHTKADLSTCKAAFDSGAAGLSLPFVATPTLHHRSPGPLGAAAEASARCEVPVGMPGFTAQMGAFVASVFKERSEAVYHPLSHPGPIPTGALPADFARRAARAMGLGAAEYLNLYSGGGPARDTFVLFDEELSVLAAVVGGKAAFER